MLRIEAFIGWVVYSHHLTMSLKADGGYGARQGEKPAAGTIPDLNREKSSGYTG